MTLQEIIVEIFEGLGEPSDLNIWDTDGVTIDPDGKGWPRLTRVVNDAAMALTMWKWPNGHQVRMRSSEAEAMIKTQVTVGAVSAWSNPTMTLSGPGITTSMRGRLIVGATSGATGLVWYHNLSTTMILTKITGTFVALESVSFYQRDYRFDDSTTLALTDPGIPYLAASGRPLEVIQVIDADTGAVLDETTKTEKFSVVDSSIGSPATVARTYGGFVFDVWPTAGLTFLVRYSKGPAVLTINDATVEPDLPAQFHRGLVLYGIWWGLRRAQESNDAYATRKDLEDFMARTKTEFDIQDDNVSGQIKIYPQGR